MQPPDTTDRRLLPSTPRGEKDLAQFYTQPRGASKPSRILRKSPPADAGRQNAKVLTNIMQSGIVCIDN